MLSITISAVVVLSCMSAVRSELQNFAVLPYRCQLNGCNNAGTCNTDTGKCACQGFGYHNYQCTQIGVPGTCKEDNNCALEGLPSVLENGQANHCVQNSDPTECMCAEGYTGDDCEVPRLSIDCSFLTDTAPQIQVMITPYNYVPDGSYKGSLYISKTFDFTNYDAILPGMPVRVSDENDEDAQVMSKRVVVDGGEVYTYVYIQHNPNYRSHLDHIIKMTCFQGVRPDASGSWDITVNDATTSSIKPLESTIDTGDLTQTTMHLLEERSGSYDVISESSSIIDIGDDLSLVLASGSPFVVQSCTVRNYASGETVSFGKELKLIDNGCVPENAVPLMRGDGVYYGNGDRSKGATSISSRFLFRLDFEAFMFLGTTNKLFFSCVLCQNRCEMVETPICSNDFTSYEDQLQTAFLRRRRRDVEDDVIESRHRRAVDGFTSDGMEVSIQIGSKQDRNSPSSTQDSDSLGGCYKSISVLLPLTLLTVLLMVSMVMAFYFCKKLTTGNSPRTNHDDVLKKP